MSKFCEHGVWRSVCYHCKPRPYPGDGDQFVSTPNGCCCGSCRECVGKSNGGVRYVFGDDPATAAESGGGGMDGSEYCYPHNTGDGLKVNPYATQPEDENDTHKVTQAKLERVRMLYFALTDQNVNDINEMQKCIDRVSEELEKTHYV